MRSSSEQTPIRGVEFKIRAVPLLRGASCLPCMKTQQVSFGELLKGVYTNNGNLLYGLLPKSRALIIPRNFCIYSTIGKALIVLAICLFIISRHARQPPSWLTGLRVACRDLHCFVLADYQPAATPLRKTAFNYSGENPCRRSWPCYLSPTAPHP